MARPLQIAIDGPVGAGKSDISARLAHAFGLVFLYTGAMYRALALACIQKGVSCKDESAVLQVLSDSDIRLVEPKPHSKLAFTVLLNGQDVTNSIFTPAVDLGSSDVSTISDVRKIMVKKQQALAHGKRVVMEGRDIGLRVLPHADLKIFLTASTEERAHRRFEQQKSKHPDRTYESVLADTEKRDTQDTGRAVDPLQKVPGAWELDSTGLSQEDVVELIGQELTKRKLV